MLKNKQILLLYLFLTIAPVIVFHQVSQFGFINYDDPAYVTENIHIRSGVTFEAIRWAFTAGYAANWHPFTWMSHMLDIQLFGLEAGPHHLTNLLFHIANTLLLFFVFNRMTKAPWKSALVAALFALHPLHVQSVAWVAERKDVLSAFFWMLAMAAYIFYVENRRFKNYLAVVLFFVLGLMAKPMLVTLPFVLLLLDYWPLERFEPYALRSLLLEKIPLFVLSALSCIVTYGVQQNAGAVASSEGIALSARIANAFVSYVTYIEKTICPNSLAVFYPHPKSLPAWQVLGAVLLLGVVTVTVLRRAKRAPYLASGWLWFAGTLAPVIGIVQVGRQAMADRYTYIPLIGLFVMAAWGVPELLAKWRYRREALFASSLLTLSCLSIVSWTQAGYWIDSISLYDHALKVTGPNDTVLNSRGDAWCRLGYLQRAIADFDGAVEIDPENSKAFYNRGVTYGKLGNHRRAIEDFDRAIEIDPELDRPFYNRGFAYGELGDFGKAIENYDRAIHINPKNAEAYNSRGVAYDKLGNYRQAISDYDMAVQINPGYAMAFNNRSIAYGRLGNYSQVIEDCSRAIEIDPHYVKPYFNRALAHGLLGNDDQAIGDLKTAARLGHEGAKSSLKSMGISW